MVTSCGCWPVPFDPEQLSLEKLLVCASEEPFVDNSVKRAGKGSHKEFCYFYDSMNIRIWQLRLRK